jgi:S-methylmethionine-dependent homocysteine/selenocysteine methylase
MPTTPPPRRSDRPQAPTRPARRAQLPQEEGRLQITDGGLETDLIFHHGLDLPDFASFPLLGDATGRAVLDAYYRHYADIARTHGVGAVLETATWRASADWGRRLGYDDAGLAAANQAAVELLGAVRDDYEPDTTIVISGNLGPRGDGYDASHRMSASEAEGYHRPQVAALTGAGADLVTALTMTYVDEAIGIVDSAMGEDVPVAISFTVETDGRLPSGETLADAVVAVDEATGGYAIHYGINCAHPDHFRPVLDDAGPWRERIGLVRANASRMSHAELDEMTELDDGDPDELAAQYADLLAAFPHVVVIGGCCGTDHRHVGAIAGACVGG